MGRQLKRQNPVTNLWPKLRGERKAKVLQFLTLRLWLFHLMLLCGRPSNSSVGQGRFYYSLIPNGHLPAIRAPIYTLWIWLQFVWTRKI